MSNKFYLKNFGFVVLAVGVGFFPQSAHAGFQWITPPATTTAPAPTEALPPKNESGAPLVTGAPEVLSPVIIDGGSASASTPVVIEGTPAKQFDTSPPVVSSAPVLESVTEPVVETQSAPVSRNNIVTLSRPTRPGDSMMPPRPGAMQPASPDASTAYIPDSTFEPAPPPAARYEPAPPPAARVDLTPTATPVVNIVPDQPLAQTPPASVMPSSGMVVLSGSPPAPEPAFDMTPALQPATLSTPHSTSDEIVRGFANHVPLAVALRQILPTGYGFSIDQNVDLGVLVSFKGGKPWRETLDEALAPVGLAVHEQGQMVEIGYPANKVPTQATMTPNSGSVATLSSAPPTSMNALSVMDEMPTAGPIVSDISWNAEPGDTLHKVLEAWSHRANVEFDWLAEYDYPIQASIHLKGKFEDAVRELLIGFESAHPQPIAELHSNSKVGQMVLVVTTRGNTAD